MRNGTRSLINQLTAEIISNEGDYAALSLADLSELQDRYEEEQDESGLVRKVTVWLGIYKPWMSDTGGRSHAR